MTDAFPRSFAEKKLTTHIKELEAALRTLREQVSMLTVERAQWRATAEDRLTEVERLRGERDEARSNVFRELASGLLDCGPEQPHVRALVEEVQRRERARADTLQRENEGLRVALHRAPVLHDHGAHGPCKACQWEKEVGIHDRWEKAARALTETEGGE